MLVNYVLIDLENVVPGNLSLLKNDCFKVKIFVGANQLKLPRDLVTAVQRLGENAEYVEISGAGKNALDFHIAFFLGKYSTEAPGACFHVISKDTGYDPLIEYLKAKNVKAFRWEDIPNLISQRETVSAGQAREALPPMAVSVPCAGLPSAPAAPKRPAASAKSAAASKSVVAHEPCLECFCERLKKWKTGLPQTREALIHHCLSSMPEVSCRNEAEKVVARLLAAGVVQEQNGKIVYDFSEKKLVAMRKPEDWLRAVKEKIAQEKTPKPRRRETLVNSVKVFCKNALSEQELVTLVDALFREGYVRENGSKLVYVFEPVPAVPVPIPAPAEKTMEKSAAGCNFVPIQCEEKPQQSWMSLMFGKGK